MFKRNAATDSPLQELAAKEISLESERKQKAAELSAAETLDGEHYVTGNGSAGVADVLTLRATIEAVTRAISTVRGKRQGVILAGYRAESEKLRSTAAAKRSALQSLETKISKLLDSLKELEGVSGCFVAETNGQNARPEKASQMLAREIDITERAATELDGKQVGNSGYFDSESTDSPISDNAVALAVLQNPSVGPSAAEVVSWLHAVERQIIRRFPSRTSAELESLPRRVRIEWADGKLNETGSYVYVPALTPKLPSRFNNDESSGWDVAKGHFRSGVQGSDGE